MNIQGFGCRGQARARSWPHSALNPPHIRNVMMVMKHIIGRRLDERMILAVVLWTDHLVLQDTAAEGQADRF